MADQTEVERQERHDEKEYALAAIEMRHFVNRPARLKIALEESYAAGYEAGARAMRERAKTFAHEAAEEGEMSMESLSLAIGSLPLTEDGKC